MRETEVLKVSSGSWTSGMQFPPGVCGASDGHVLSPVTQQKATWLVLNLFSFRLWHGLVLLAECALRCSGFCHKAGQYCEVQPRQQKLDAGYAKVLRSCLTPCWKSSEILKLSILSSWYFPASCHLYAHSTYRSILKLWNVNTLSTSWKHNNKILYLCMTVEQN